MRNTLGYLFFCHVLTSTPLGAVSGCAFKEQQQARINMTNKFFNFNNVFLKRYYTIFYMYVGVNCMLKVL